jgi:hypothetical protein
MPITAIILFIGILPTLLFSGYQSFNCHPAEAGWFKAFVKPSLIVVHDNINAMVSTLSPVFTFKAIA